MDFTVNNADSNIQGLMGKESLDQQQWDCDGDNHQQSFLMGEKPM